MHCVSAFFFPPSLSTPDLLVSAGESGSADTVRDPRGFAVKLYTEEGNWDLTGNNTPIFFIRDALLVGPSRWILSLLSQFAP